MKNIYLVLILAIGLFSCTNEDEKIKGNGDVQRKVYEIQDFAKVESSGAFNISFVQDSLWKINVEAESNILPLIDVYKSGTKLVIEHEDNYNFDLNHPIEIEIHHAGVEEVDFSGAGSINLDQLEVNSFMNTISGTCNVIGFVRAELVDFILSGAGNIDVSVDCYDLEASLSGTGNFIFAGNSDNGGFSIAGTGNIDASNLFLDYAWCNISGVGDVNLNVSMELSVTISGIGDITYRGEAEIIEENIIGTGSVTKIN